MYSVAESKGHCRYRIAGLSLIFEIEVRNSLSPWDHPGEIFVLVKLSVDKNWARITYKPVPTATLGIARAVAIMEFVGCGELFHQNSRV